MSDDFVGRNLELERYRAFLKDDPPPWMMDISGIAGMGKTTLLNLCKSDTESNEPQFMVILLDFSPEKKQLPYPLTSNEEESLPYPLKFMQKLAHEAGEFCSSQALSVFNKILETKEEELIKFYKALKDLEPEQKTNLEPEQKTDLKHRGQYHAREAVELALYDLLETFTKDKLIIMLDTCELLYEPKGWEVGQWLINEFLPLLQNFMSPRCLVVTASREPLSSSFKTLIDQKPISLPLKGLEKEDVKTYLQDNGINNSDVLDVAYDMTQGHGMGMEIIAECWHKIGHKAQENMAEPIAEPILEELRKSFNDLIMMRLINKRILKNLEQPSLDLIKYGVLLRNFDQPMLKAVFPELLTDENYGKEDWFEKFTDYSFVLHKYQGTTENNPYTFHELIRTALTQELHNPSSSDEQEKERIKNSRKIALANALAYVESEGGEGTPDWYYYQIAQDEEQGMVLWEEAILRAHEENNQALVATLLQVAKDKGLNLGADSLLIYDAAKRRFDEQATKEEDALARKQKSTDNIKEHPLDHPKLALKLSNQEPLPKEPPPPSPPPPISPLPKEPPPSKKKSRVLVACILLILLLAAISSFSYVTYRSFATNMCKTVSSHANLGVVTMANGESIGISDGNFAFDTNRPGGYGDLKSQAAAKLKGCDDHGAATLWQRDTSLDTSDAESLIYLEDQRVLASGHSYITFVVATTLTGDVSAVATGRDNLQGAYVAQKELNDGFRLQNGLQVRLLIANSGSQASYAKQVAEQIVRLAQTDKSIVGVMGWPYSSQVVAVSQILAAAHLPMVSPTASSDDLTGISPYFFRVAPTDMNQAILGAKYAQQVLHVHKAALFVDPNNIDSRTLARDFSMKFAANSPQNTILEEDYRVGQPDLLPSLLQDAFTNKVDMIYFSGTATNASVLLNNLPTSGPFANIQVMGGNGLYQVKAYSATARAAFNRLHFTTFAYPDEWQLLATNNKQPSFFKNYQQIFDPNHTHIQNPYSYSRADSDTLLSYDAMQTLLQGSKKVSTQKSTTFTGDALRQSLVTITGDQAIQGVSGQISFGSDGNPINKLVLMLVVNHDGYIQFEQAQGCFLLNHCST